MRLYFKQRFFSWFDSYDIYDEATGEPVFTVEGKLAWGHCLHILDAQGRHIATVKERILTFLPKFELYLGERYVGEMDDYIIYTDTACVSRLRCSVNGASGISACPFPLRERTEYIRIGIWILRFFTEKCGREVWPKRRRPIRSYTGRRLKRH